MRNTFEAKSDYNGYTNYETWATALWLDNDEGAHNDVRELVKESRDAGSPKDWVAEHLEDYVQELLLTEDAPANLASDLLAHSLSRVNWREMAENYLEDN